MRCFLKPTVWCRTAWALLAVCILLLAAGPAAAADEAMLKIEIIECFNRRRFLRLALQHPAICLKAYAMWRILWRNGVLRFATIQSTTG